MIGRLRTRLGRAGNAIFTKAHLASYAAWPLATAHYVMAGTDALAEWSLGLLLTGTALVVMALLARAFVPAPARLLDPAPASESVDALTLTRP